MQVRRCCCLLATALAVLSGSRTTAYAFSSSATTTMQQQQHRTRRPTFLATQRPRSVVEDLDGPTPVLEDAPIEKVDPNTVEGIREVFDPAEFPRPIPHQPWRRGDTAGCEAPITAVWRREAEKYLTESAAFAGGKVLDVTWFLTAVLVTIDENVLPMKDFLKSRGPIIEVKYASPPMYYDPENPEPEPIWDDDEEVVYQRATEDELAEKDQRLYNKYATVIPDEDEDPDEPHVPLEETVGQVPLYMNEETRDEVALLDYQGQEAAYHEGSQPFNTEALVIETDKISSVAQAILDALEAHEDEWQVLVRHQVILTCPNSKPDVIDTQRQFDFYRDQFVVVETVDPWESNRTLKGQLVDRNSMDLILNIQGRMVTVPHNFVQCVRLAPTTTGERVNTSDVYQGYEGPKQRKVLNLKRRARARPQ
jgi:hypothetical protein